MSDQAVGRIDAELGSAGRSVWPSRLRLGVEFVLLFALALWADHALTPGANGAYPHPVWLPVIVLSLQHGWAVGIAAAVTAAGLFVWGGLPQATLSEDLYQYIGRVAAEPIGWTCAALLIGHVRQRQIQERAELEAELAERDQHCRAVAQLCEDLRQRAEMLERHIAANAMSSHIDIAEAVCGLHEFNWINFEDRLTRFIVLMTGSAEFALYVLRDNALELAMQPRDDNMSPADPVVPAHDPLFGAIVNDRKTLSATRPADRELIDHRGVLVGPLLEHSPAKRVIGMLRIGSADLIDFPEDIERRFALTCSEIARLLGRAILIERAQPAPAPAVRPIERLEQAHAFAQRRTSRKTNDFDSTMS